MKSIILVIAGLVTGIGATVFTLGTQQEQPAKVTTRVIAPTTEPDIQSPFAPVATSTTKIANDTVSSTAAPEPLNTRALPEKSIAEVDHYRDLLAYLQYVDNADSNDLREFLRELPPTYHHQPFYSAITTAIYQRWAELDIDEALTYITELSNDTFGPYGSNSIQAISAIAAVQPDYVRQWITDNAPDNPGLLHAANSAVSAKDPEAFLRDFISTADLDDLGRSEDFSTIHSAIMQWAEKDPQAALAFLESDLNSAAMQRRGMKQNILYMWFEKDPDTAMVEIETLLNDPTADSESQMMIADIYISHLAKSDPDGAMQYAMTLENPMLREGVMMNIIYSWDEHNSTNLRSFIDQLPAAERERLLPMAGPAIARNMAREDPAGAIAWAQQLPEGQKQGAIMNVVVEWIELDPASATDWIATLPDTPANQNLIMEAAGPLLFRDPDQGKAVFATLPENIQIQFADQMVFMQDPELARQWLSQQNNPVVQEIGSIALDSMNPDIDPVGLLDRIASLQIDSRQNLLFSAVSQHGYSNSEAIKEWVNNTPLITDQERTALLQMTGSGSAAYYQRSLPRVTPDSVR